MIRAGLFACFLVAGCAIFPMPTPPVPVPTCESPPRVHGARLDCQDAVQAALALLDRAHPPIRSIDFGYGPCRGPDPNLIYDCAVQLFGTVTIRFVGDVAPVKVAIEYGREPFVLE